MDKPTLPKGTRDFGPQTMAKRQFIFNTIRGVFQKFGFQPLETPAMENLSTLTGKYGEEGDQLLFKILDSGDFIKQERERVLERLTLESSIKNLVGKFAIDFYQQLRERNPHPISFIPSNDIIQNQVFGFLDYFFNKNSNDQSTIAAARDILITHSERLSRSLFALLYVPLDMSGQAEAIGVKIFRDAYPEISQLLNDGLLNSSRLTKNISEKGLRYDLTVPFARYVVMNRNEVSFPFKRYQIQPVWRADRPQKGRYREFYQCDADVVGTNSLICEAEIILMIKETFSKLGIGDYSIKINHRAILNGVAEEIDAKGNETSLFVAIDKLDKIGEEGVKQELRTRGFSEENLTKLFNILNLSGSNTNKLAFLANKVFDRNQEGQRGLRDLKEVFNMLKDYDADETHVDFDVTLARGLSYYTGCIFEVKIHNVGIGSVSGGGRYDNLTQTFGDKENLSGVGFSFGVDRIYDAMEELKLFPKDAQISSKVLICHFDEESMRYGLKVLTQLRSAGIASEIYPDLVKIKKQLDYGNKKMIPFTIVIGSDEMNSGKLAFKAMETGEQSKLTVEEIIGRLS